MVRQALVGLLENAGFTITAEVANGHLAVEAARARCPDVAVLDFAMPELNGLDAARQILAICPRVRTILLTMHTENQYVLQALKAGIRGYVIKTQSASDLVRAINEVLQGTVYLSPVVSHTVVQAYLTKSEMPPDPLTTREREVLQLIAEGQRTKAIAGRLGLSVKTAESHRVRIMQKTGIHDTAGLVRYAIRRGLIQP